MTTSLGIAATTAVLRQMLQNALPAAQLAGVLGAVSVTAVPPDRIDSNAAKSSLNLFMYQVRPNTGWMMQDLPSHDTRGRRLTNPPLALDLSYMLSAYGAADYHCEILLGYSALVLHQTRVLTREAVRATFSGAVLPADLALLATADLEGQEELVALSMDPLTSDEISRLWSVFGEKYRPSIAFQATVVLMRASDPAVTPGPPVRRARLAVTPSIAPTITDVEPSMVVAAAGAGISLVGTGLLPRDATVRFGSGETAPPEPGSTDMRIDAVLPGTLLAGVVTARVQLPARFEADLRRGVESNLVPFTLRPAFAPIANPITVGVRVDTPTTTTTTITVALRPLVGRRQQVSLLLDELVAAPGPVPRSYSFAAPSRQNAAADVTGDIRFPVAGVRRARYVVRVRVDGAETPLEATGDVYDKPVVDLT